MLFGSEDIYRIIVDSAEEGIWIADKNGVITYVNNKLVELSGYDKEELIGKKMFEFADDNNRIIMEKSLDESLRGKRDNYLFSICNKRGEFVPMLVATTPMQDENGVYIGTVEFMSDMTMQKKLEEELFQERCDLANRVEERTKELSQEKNEAELYLDLMGHDISNMHQIIMGRLQLAQEIMDEKGRLESDEKEMIDIPLRILGRSARLIDNVLKLQKLRRDEFKEETIDLSNLLSSIVKEYGPVVPANSIRFVGNRPSCVRASELLYDVFRNLVGNAIKHSDKPGIDINIKLETVNEDGKNHFKVSVEDNGPGIPDNMKGAVFNRLQRGETTARGSGLGLYLVKSFVDSFHGRVLVENRVTGDYTKGARFVVLLPAIEGRDIC
jgi:PAS domain S-box-containing protein